MFFFKKLNDKKNFFNEDGSLGGRSCKKKNQDFVLMGVTNCVSQWGEQRPWSVRFEDLSGGLALPCNLHLSFNRNNISEAKYVTHLVLCRDLLNYLRF